MQPSTDTALKSILIVSLILVLFILVSWFAHAIFVKKSKNSSINTSKSKVVTLKGSLHNTAFREGKINVEVRVNAIVIPHLLTSSHPDFTYEVNTKDILYFSTRKVSSKEKIEWLQWSDIVSPHKMENTEKNLYITEGGIFNDREMSPTTTFHLSPSEWSEKGDIVFVKMAYPNGILPYNYLYGDNTIIRYKIDEKSEKSITVPGIPKNSRLNLVKREKHDGVEKLLDSFRVPQKAPEIFVNHGKFSLISR